MMPSLLALLVNLIMVTQLMAGTWTPNNFFYKPDAGARGEQEKIRFDSGLDRVDTRLGNERWLNDQAFGGNLQAAIAAIGNNTTVLNIPAGTWPIASDLTVPVNMTLKLPKGAILTIATGKTLTINGTLDAGRYQIFACTGTGKVVLNKVPEVSPEWWGAVADGTTDSTGGVQAALNAAPAGGKVLFAAGAYSVGPLSVNKPLFLKGVMAHYYDNSDANRPYENYPTRLRAKASQTHVLAIGDLTADHKLNGVTIEDLAIDGGSLEDNTRTISNAALVIQNLTYARFNRMMVTWTVGRGFYLEDFWDSTFSQCWVTACGKSDGQAIWVAPLYSTEWGGRNVNNITFDVCHFEHISGRLIESQDVAHGGNNSLDVLRFINCKFEKGSGTNTNASHKSLIYLPYVQRLYVQGCQFSGYLTTDGWDNLLEVGGYYGYAGPIITGNCIATGTADVSIVPYFLRLMDACPPAVLRANAAVIYDPLKSFYNTSYTAQPNLEYLIQENAAGLVGATQNPLWRSVHELDGTSIQDKFVYDANSLNKQQTVATLHTVGNPLVDLAKHYYDSTNDLRIRMRVKITGTSCKINLATNNLGGTNPVYSYGEKTITSTSWTWIEWTIPAANITDLYNLFFWLTDNSGDTSVLYVDGFYMIPLPPTITGTATISSGQTEITVSNANVVAASIIGLAPADANSAALSYYVSDVTGGSFKIKATGAPGGNAAFSWWIVR